MSNKWSHTLLLVDKELQDEYQEAGSNMDARVLPRYCLLFPRLGVEGQERKDLLTNLAVTFRSTPL